MRRSSSAGVPERYFATLCPGFEEVVAGEARLRLGDAVVTTAEPGRVLIESACAPADVLALRSVNHVHLTVAELEGIPPERAGLEYVERLVAGVDFGPAVEKLAGLWPPRGPAPAFRVTAQRAGEQEYRSPEIAAAIGSGVVARHGWPVSMEEHDAEIVAFVNDDRMLLGVRLTREGSLHRRSRAEWGRTSLKATVAYSLLWFAQPRPGTVVLDPLCGSGTIPIEAAVNYEGLISLGGDRSPAELAVARVNVAHAGADVGLARWDARSLPLASASIDAVVSDLPFGRRTGTHTGNRHLYPGLLRELGRVVKPGGRAVLYTTERRLMEYSLARAREWRLERAIATILSSLRPVVWILKRG